MIHAIINPVSGAGVDRTAAARRAAMIESAASRRGAPVTIAFTARQGHARELAVAARDAGAAGVVVWGGDGTFNEAAGALIGSDIPVGLVPAGSGNGLAGALGVPRDAAAALDLAFDGAAKRIDAGRIDGRIFFNVAGIGFDARVAALFNQRGAGSRGGIPYFLIGIREGCRYRGCDYRVTLEGERSSHRALLIVFANGREYGLGARIAPDARLDDGLLDALIVEDRSIIARFWSARYLARGTPHLAPLVVTKRVTQATVECDSDIEFHVDGEPGRATGRLDVEIVPGALLIRSAVPA